MPPLEVWRRLAHSIDSRLTAREDWPILARAIQEADEAGCNVAVEVPRLANGGLLSAERPATELAYQLRAATQTTSDTEPTHDADQKQTGIDPILHSQLDTQPSRPDPNRPTR